MTDPLILSMHGKTQEPLLCEPADSSWLHVAVLLYETND